VVTASIGFTSEKFSEAAAAKKFAASVNADHHERIVSPDAVSVVEKLAWHYDEPFADSSAVPTYYVSQVAREFVTVALSGDGGDENFAGYRRYRFDSAENRVRQMIPKSIRKMAFGTAGALYPQADWLPRPLRAKATLTNISLDHSQAYFNSVYGLMSKESSGLFDGDLTASLQNYSPFDLFREFYDRAQADDPLSRVQYVDIKTYLVDDILTKVDRASMAVSLEVRCPILDHEFMENAARIPSSLKLKNGVGKYIFKEAIKKIVPAEVLNRPKMGFSIPLAEWLRGDLKDLAHSMLFDRNDSLLNQQTVNKMWDRHQSGLRDLSVPLWTILMFRLWQRKFAS
jgi:asparagine synthase (glutamine-hydrolysing)